MSSSRNVSMSVARAGFAGMKVVGALAAATAVGAGFVIAGFAGSGCIQRTAAPRVGGVEAPGSAPSAALEAANARIAGMSRTDLLGGAGVHAFKLQGDADKAPITVVPVSGQPFGEAVRADIKGGASHEWAVQLQALTAAPIETGDALLATFYLRAEAAPEGALGETGFVLELAEAPYTKSVEYPVQAGPEWAKVQVRFTAARAYPAGKAQIVFRLGYDAEVIDIGGISVESFGKRVPLSVLPSTQGADRRREKDAATAAKQMQAAAAPVPGGELAFTIDLAKTIGPISPYVYGINSQKLEGQGVTVRRMGGNRQSAYNWEINASNAGSDYLHSSDDWPCTVLGYRDCDSPAAQFVDFVLANRQAGVDSLVTVPMLDYVSADKRGAVPDTDKAPSARWVLSFAVKPSRFAATPDLGDGKVYQDEFVNFLIQKVGRAGPGGGARFYSLDNEPALWSGTHPRAHPAKTTYDEMVKRTEATAGAIVKLDPGAEILGAVAYGWSEYMSLQDAPDSAAQNAQFGTYIDFFLAAMKDLEASHHQRLVHVLDVHWYPEAKGTKRITEKDTSPKTIAARLQAPRSLWDPTYVERSWITAAWGKPIRLIPWLEERIAARYPGTKLSMTEYNFGAPDHISGGLAQADVLGIFGREGLYLGAYWGDGAGNGALPSYVKAAFQLYRNYDGHGATFGDTAVTATTGDVAKASVYAATDSKRPGVLTVIVINKELHAVFDGKIALQGSAHGGIDAAGFVKAHVFVLDGTGAEIRAQPDIIVSNGQIAYRLPPLSATLFVCERR